MSPPRHRWVVFGAMAGVYFSFGIAVASIAPMLTFVRGDLGVSRGAMGFALGAWALIYIVTAPIAGRFIDRFGLGWSLALGGVSVTGSMVLRAGAQGRGSLWLAIAFFGVFGPLVSASAPKLLATWFPDEQERRRGVGWYSVAPGVGGTLVVATTNPLLLPWFDESWRSVLLFEGAIGALATVAWIVVWNRVEQPVSTDESSVAAQGGSFRHLLGSREIRLILVVAFALFFVTHALGNWLPTVLEEFSGLSPTAAGGWVAAGGVISILCGATIPAFARPDRMYRLVAGLFGLTAVGLLLVLLMPASLHGPLSLITFARGALIGLAIVTLLSADRVTPANAGIANGLWFSVAEVGGVTGPLAMGALADSIVGYEGALIAVIVVTGFGAVVSMASQGHRAQVGDAAGG